MRDELSGRPTDLSVSNETMNVPEKVLLEGEWMLKYSSANLGTVIIVHNCEEYRELTSEDSPDLEALSHEFDELLDRMQAPAARAASDALFAAARLAVLEEIGRGGGDYEGYVWSDGNTCWRCGKRCPDKFWIMRELHNL